ncbi:hypothetical protein E2553_38265 [Paraburkholderia dipogonis]|uniref:Uncharacterized protein n=1 Tax=Paraburkholderia dipogonis TaxID=1211383 RepID=A0A4Y8MIN6_9BURK|nr:hypothetical protein [Paraburkholderia dipogonis]TFE37340.1 hypothetical protein E2553_38265 [Paraburkholderia dipogonis]
MESSFIADLSASNMHLPENVLTLMTKLISKGHTSGGEKMLLTGKDLTDMDITDQELTDARDLQIPRLNSSMDEINAPNRVTPFFSQFERYLGSDDVVVTLGWNLVP